MIKQNIVILFLLIVVHLFAEPFKVITQTDDKIVFGYQLDSHSITNKTNISMEQFADLIKSNHIQFLDSALTIPVIKELIALPVDDYQLQITDVSYFPVQMDQFDESARAVIGKISVNPVFNQFMNPRPLVINKLGYGGDYPLGTLTFVPYAISTSGISLVKSITFTVHFTFHQEKLTREKSSVSRLPVLNREHLYKNVTVLSRFKNDVAVPKTGINYYGNALRIYTGEEGIYKISFNDIEDAGINPGQIQVNSIKLLNRGQQVPLLIAGEEDGSFDRGDYLEFWADEILNENTGIYTNLYKHPFTKENIYILVWGEGNGVRIIEESAGIEEEAPQYYNRSLYFRDKIHWEVDGIFAKLGAFAIDKMSFNYDNWLVDNGISAIGRRSYDVELAYPDSFSTTPVKVTAMLHGRTENRHKVNVWINDKLVNGVTEADNWLSESFYKVESVPGNDVFSSQLRHGMNEVDIQVFLPETGGTTDMVALNWVEVEYNRQYKAFNNFIKFHKPSFIPYPNLSLFQFDVTNFTTPDIQIYKRGVSKLVGFQVIPVNAGQSVKYSIKFQDHIVNQDVEYVALRESQKLKPAKIEFMEPLDGMSVNTNLLGLHSADYLLLTGSEFYNRSQDIIEIMTSLGHQAEVIDVQNIYDQFNNSIKSPLAIKEFLRYVYFHWNQDNRLKYVLLLGDASYDYRGELYENADIVPSYFYQSYKFGAVPTDFEYCLLVGNDLIPDIAVGRIPVSRNSELVNYIEKLNTFVSARSGDWMNKSLFISGNDASTYEYDDPTLPAFRSQNQRVIDVSVGSQFTTYKLNTVKDQNLDFDPNFGSTTDLRNYFDEGLAFVEFMGHGGGGIWADVSLLNVADINLLSNDGKFPFVSSLTCFTGAFENYNRYSLSEKLLLESDKGSMAFFGSAGLGWLHNDYALGLKLPFFLLNQNLPFGDAVNLTRMFYLNSSTYVGQDSIFTTPGYGGLYKGMLYQYNLLGDPALKFNLPAPDLEVTLNEVNVNVGDTIHFTVKAPLPFAAGYYELADYKNQPRIQIPFSYSGDSTIAEVIVPESFPEEEATFRVFLSDGEQDYTGYCSFSVSYPFITSIVITPENPQPGDSIQIHLTVNSPDSIDFIRIKWLKRNTAVFYPCNPAAGSGYITGHIPLDKYTLDYYYSIYVTLPDGQVKKYTGKTFSIADHRADLAFSAGKIKLIPHSGGMNLSVPLYNHGSSNVDSADFKLYLGRANFLLESAVIDTLLTINANDSLVFTYGWNDLNELRERELIGQIIAVSQADKNPDNNLDSVRFIINAAYVEPGIGISLDKINPDTLKFENWAAFSMNGSLVTRSGFIEYDKVDISNKIKNLNTISILPLMDTVERSGIEIKKSLFLPDSLLKINFYYRQEYFNTQGKAEKNIRAFTWNSQISQWIGVESNLDTILNIVSVPVLKDGLYCTLYSFDVNPPIIEFSVDGRPLISKSIVSEKPNISIYIEDDNGVQVERNLVQIQLNGLDVPSNTVFIPDSLQNPGYLGIKVYPQLDPGEHILTVRVQDINHNIAEKTVSMVVSSEFNLHVFGNYPNPFSDQTIFSFYNENIEPFDDFEIRLYTISGRLIRVIKEDIHLNPVNVPHGARRTGYNELIWDGTDADGNQVANGVYFAMLRAKYQGKVKEKILKVARLR